jgi:hypothetical protein
MISIDQYFNRYRASNRKIYIVFFILFSSLLLLSIYLTCSYYLHIKLSFFDDTFIYMHIARNAAYHGTWQYYPLVDRPALLASSPLQICILTIATFILKLIGLNSKSLFTVKVVMILDGCITYLIFAPVWRRDILKYIVIGVFYFYLAAVFDTVFEFEGGLLFLWSLSVMLLLSQRYRHRLKELCILLPLGVLIRPELAIIIYAVIFVSWYKQKIILWEMLRFLCITTLITAIVWVAVCILLHVYPIPVTWWAKSALPNLVSDQNLIQVVFQYIGSTLSWAVSLSAASRAAVGAVVIFYALVIMSADSKSRFSELLVVVVLSILLAMKLPSNFWWYYQNIIVLLMGLFIYIALFSDHNVKQRLYSSVYVCGLLFLTAFPYRVSPHLPWDFNATSRAQGYLYLASRIQPDGTYNLPGLGDVLIKGPEIGILAYFSGNAGWEWDSAGLAQTAVSLGALNSPLKWFYPKTLWIRS